MARQMQLAKRGRYSGIASGLINGARLGYQLYSKYSAAKRSYNNAFGSSAPASAPGPVTTNYDSKVMYSRKRASPKFRRKARRYRKFVKKVLNANDYQKEKQRVLFIDNVRITSLANSQVMATQYLNLYGGNTGTAGYRDLLQMENALGDTSTANTKTYYRSAHMEVAIKNTGSDGCYVDVFYYISRKDFKTGQDFGALLTNSFSNMPSNMGGSIQTTLMYGTTPILAKEFTENFKIFKKTTTLLGAGNQMDFALSKKKNFVCDYTKASNIGSLKGLTMGVILVVYGLPNTATDATAGQPVAAAVNCNITRSYTLTSNRTGLVDAGCCLITS